MPPSTLLPQVESEFTRRLRLQKELTERARALPGVIGEQRVQMQQAYGEARRSARAEAARALAAGLSQGAPVTSGAALAAGRQTGLDVATMLGKLGLEEASALTGLQREEAIAGIEAAQFELETPSGAALTQEEVNAVEGQIQNIKKAQTGTFTDEGEQAARDIRLLLNQTDNPQVKAYIERRAKEVEAELESTPISRALGF